MENYNYQDINRELKNIREKREVLKSRLDTLKHPLLFVKSLFMEYGSMRRKEIIEKVLGHDESLVERYAFLREKYKDRFVHQGKVKILVHSDAGWHEKIPAYIHRVIQDPATLVFSGQHWAPPIPFDWEGDHFDIRQLDSLLIYESHVGMAQERLGVGTFTEFAEYLIPSLLSGKT